MDNAYKVMVSGHRPKNLGGYITPNPTETWVRNSIRAVLESICKKKHPEKVVGITGMALGTDTIFAEVCLDLGVPIIAAVPFEGQPDRWPPPHQGKYRRILKKAHEVVYVDRVPGYEGQDFKDKFLARNRWMVDHSDMGILVWNGSGGGTAYTARYLDRKDVPYVILDPKTCKIRSSCRIVRAPRRIS